MGLVFVLGTIISMGLSLTMKQITGPFRDVRFVIMALLTNFVVPPILAFILIRAFSLDEPLAVGLLLVSLAAGTPALPKTAVFAKVDTAAATVLNITMTARSTSIISTTPRVRMRSQTGCLPRTVPLPWLCASTGPIRLSSTASGSRRRLRKHNIYFW